MHDYLTCPFLFLGLRILLATLPIFLITRPTIYPTIPPIIPPSCGAAVKPMADPIGIPHTSDPAPIRSFIDSMEAMSF
jgi:hypothetical protein